MCCLGKKHGIVVNNKLGGGVEENFSYTTQEKFPKR